MRAVWRRARVHKLSDLAICALVVLRSAPAGCPWYTNRVIAAELALFGDIAETMGVVGWPEERHLSISSRMLLHVSAAYSVPFRPTSNGVAAGCRVLEALGLTETRRVRMGGQTRVLHRASETSRWSTPLSQASDELCQMARELDAELMRIHNECRDELVTVLDDIAKHLEWRHAEHVRVKRSMEAVSEAMSEVFDMAAHPKRTLARINQRLHREEERRRRDAARAARDRECIRATLRYVAAQTAGERKPCPKCGADMRFREGRYGPFWGCVTWPECNGTREFEGSLGEYPGGDAS